jgi:hypothetical protein
MLVLGLTVFPAARSTASGEAVEWNLAHEQGRQVVELARALNQIRDGATPV